MDFSCVSLNDLFEISVCFEKWDEKLQLDRDTFPRFIV